MVGCEAACNIVGCGEGFARGAALAPCPAGVFYFLRLSSVISCNHQHELTLHVGGRKLLWMIQKNTNRVTCGSARNSVSVFFGPLYMQLYKKIILLLLILVAIAATITGFVFLGLLALVIAIWITRSVAQKVETKPGDLDNLLEASKSWSKMKDNPFQDQFFELIKKHNHKGADKRYIMILYRYIKNGYKNGDELYPVGTLITDYLKKGLLSAETYDGEVDQQFLDDLKNRILNEKI